MPTLTESNLITLNTELKQGQRCIRIGSSILPVGVGGAGGTWKMVWSNIIPLNSLTNPAAASDVLSTKQFYVSEAYPITGTIPTVSAQLSGGSVIVPSGYIAAPQSFSVQGTDVSSTTAEASDVLSGKIFYTSGGVQTSGIIPTVSATIQNGAVTVPSGFISSAQSFPMPNFSEVTATPTMVAPGAMFYDSTGELTEGSMPFALGGEITPTTSSQTISGGVYLSDDITVFGDAALVASNIVSGVSIFGVSGTFQGGGATYSSATVTPNQVLSGVVFYDSVGNVSSGAIRVIPASTITPTTSTQYISAGVYTGGTQTILGDAALVGSNIASGVTIFGVPGTYEGSGGTGGGSVGGSAACQLFFNCDRLFQYDIPTITSFQTPIRDIPYGCPPYVTCINGDLYRLMNAMGNSESISRSYRSVKMTNTGDYSYVSIGNGNVYAAIKNGNLVKVTQANATCTVTTPTTAITGVTQVICRPPGFYFLASGTLYFTKFDDDGNGNFVVAQLQDKVITKLLNQAVPDSEMARNKHPVVAIDEDGNAGLITCQFYDEGQGEGGFSAESTIAWSAIGTNNNNDSFLNLYYYPPDYYGEGNSTNINFAIRSSGLWYTIWFMNQSSWQWQSTPWAQESNSLSVAATRWLGDYYGYSYWDYYHNEQTGEEGEVRDFYEQRIPLFIDSTGRLMAVRADLSATNVATGITIQQVGNDSGWTYAPPSISHNGSAICQKSGQLVVLHASRGTAVEKGTVDGTVYKETRMNITYDSYSTNTVDNITATYGYTPSGRLFAVQWHGMWFTTLSSAIDLSVAGGSFTAPPASPAS